MWEELRERGVCIELAQYTLENTEANDRLVGIVFHEKKNRIPLPCSVCATDNGKCKGKTKCYQYEKWSATDGKLVSVDRYGRSKNYLRPNE